MSDHVITVAVYHVTTDLKQLKQLTFIDFGLDA